MEVAEDTCAAGFQVWWQFLNVSDIWILPGLETALSRRCFGWPQEPVCWPEHSELQAARLPPAKQRRFTGPQALGVF